MSRSAPSRWLRAQLAACAFYLILVGTITGCQGGDAAPPPCPVDPAVHGLAVAAGGRTGSARPSLPAEPDPTLDVFRGAVERGEQGIGATVVRVDGRPAIACVVPYDTTAGNDAARAAARTTFIETVRLRAAAVTAQVPEANPLEALAIAAAAAGDGGTVVLADSGLQTLAPLDFRQPGLFTADPTRIADALRAGGMLPDLHGRTVVLVGIGYTADPQPALSTGQRAHLVAIWKQIATEAGATAVRTVDAPDTTAPLPGLPSVSTVPLPPTEPLDLSCNGTTVLPDDGPVGFRPGKTDFANENAAREVLGRFASWLSTTSGARGHIVGSIAHYGENSVTGLALSRAERVRTVLVELGVDPDNITAEGAGWGPFPTPTAPPGPADSLNRRVVIQLSCR